MVEEEKHLTNFYGPFVISPLLIVFLLIFLGFTWWKIIIEPWKEIQKKTGVFGDVKLLIPPDSEFPWERDLLKPDEVLKVGDGKFKKRIILSEDLPKKKKKKVSNNNKGPDGTDIGKCTLEQLSEIRRNRLKELKAVHSCVCPTEDCNVHSLRLLATWCYQFIEILKKTKLFTNLTKETKREIKDLYKWVLGFYENDVMYAIDENNKPYTYDKILQHAIEGERAFESIIRRIYFPKKSTGDGDVVYKDVIYIDNTFDLIKANNAEWDKIESTNQLMVKQYKCKNCVKKEPDYAKNFYSNKYFCSVRFHDIQPYSGKSVFGPRMKLVETSDSKRKDLNSMISYKLTNDVDEPPVNPENNNKDNGKISQVEQKSKKSQTSLNPTSQSRVSHVSGKDGLSSKKDASNRK